MIRIKTPHRKPLRHLLNFYAFFFSGSVCSLYWFHAPSAYGLAILAVAAFTAAMAVVGGLPMTIIVRALFGLVQTGRFIEYACFWLAASGSVYLSEKWFPNAAGNSPVALRALALVATAFVAASLAGVVPWKERSWLPIRKKSITVTPWTKMLRFIARAALWVYADILDTCFSSKSRAAWQAVVDYEARTLPADSAGRAGALVNLAHAHLGMDGTGAVENMTAANELAEKAYGLLFSSGRGSTGKAGEVLSLRGRLQYGLGNIDESIVLHQAAETVYEGSWSLSWQRCQNLHWLAIALRGAGRHAEAATADANGDGLALILRQSSPRMLPH